MNQPIPKVSENDVKRIVKRDYPENKYNQILEILNQYGVEDWESEKARVQLAVLKLSDANLKEIEINLENAKKDYRDVLLWAEYPLCAKQNTWDLTDEKKEEIYRKDWDQYQKWLSR